MFRAELGGDEHFAVIVGDIHGSEPPLVRLHSQCVTGDVLGSLKCDCGEQLEGALEKWPMPQAAFLFIWPRKGAT